MGWSWIHNLKKAGFENTSHIEEKSEFALPELLKGNEERFDLIFVDGFHTFDHTLIDCFYATRLLNVGGYLVVDDTSYPAIQRVIDYLLTYPCYEFFKGVSTPKRRQLKREMARLAVSIIPLA